MDGTPYTNDYARSGGGVVDPDFPKLIAAFFDFGYLGKLGFVPGWPGEEVCPPQPMVSQTRAVLDKYTAHGGAYWEKVIADTGHTPCVEKPDEFVALLLEHLQSAKV